MKPKVEYHIDGKMCHKLWMGWGVVKDKREAMRAVRRREKMHGGVFRVLKVTTVVSEEVIYQTERQSE